MKALAVELSGTQTIVCESCGHNNTVETPPLAGLQTVIRCSECCHPQSLCQRHLAASAEFPDFSVKSGEDDGQRST
jgi:hypothetical protein